MIYGWRGDKITVYRTNHICKIKFYFKLALKRQIIDVVRISQSEAKYILNSKNEFHQAPIVRQVVVRGIDRTLKEILSNEANYKMFAINISFINECD